MNRDGEPAEQGASDAPCPELQGTFEQAGIGIVHVAPDGHFIRVNPAFCRLVGRDAEQLAELTIADVTHPDDIQRDFQVLGEIASTQGRTILHETRLLRADGEVVEIEIAATLVIDESGAPRYLLGFITDIARRRAAEAEARDSHARLEAFYEEAFEGIGISDRGKILDVNPSICEVFGYSPEELVGASVETLVHPDDREMVFDRVRSGHTGIYEHRGLHKDGSILHVEVQGKAVDFQGRPARMTAVHDITARKAAEAGLARWAHLFENAAWGIGISDASGERIGQVNPAFAAMHRCSREELEGLRIFELYPESDREAAREGLHIADEKGHHTFRARQRRPDGSEFPVEVDLSVVRDAEGGFLYRAANVQDITRELELQEQLEQAQRMEALGVLAGGIAHDFNNLLSGVMGYAELVQMNLQPGTGDHRDLTELLRAARRGRELVQQILTFSRRTAQTTVHVDLCELVREAHRLLRASIPTTIPIGLELPPSCPPVLADPTQLHQVVMNLGTNALQALRDGGGRLDICVEVAEVTTEESGPGWVRLVVSDTGHGMSEEVRARALDPFFTTREAGEGTGMGLAVVHGIVRSHGGTVQLESAPGEGTRVTVSFPRTVAGAVSEAAPVSDDVRGDERLLIVDDEETVAQVTARILGTLGYDVTWCCRPEEVLARLERGERYDLLITDQTMPGMSGITLTEAVHRLWPGLPVILCSGFTETMTAAQARALGIEALLWKPIEVRELGRAVRRVLDAVDAEG